MDCIFCEIAKKNIPSKCIYEDEIITAIMDIKPICDGHIMIIPKDHYETVFDVPKDILNHMYDVAQKLMPVLMKALNEDGMTFSINYGSMQEIKHLHLHLLPNFKKSPLKTIDEVYDSIMENM